MEVTMERVVWKTHNGKKILYINYSNLSAVNPEQKKEIFDTIKMAWDVVEFTAPGERILFLSDATNTTASPDIMKKIKEFAAYTAANGKIEKECVVGISGIQQILVAGVNMFSKTKLVMFNSISEAADWLTK
jgi:hypothetical protein